VKSLTRYTPVIVAVLVGGLLTGCTRTNNPSTPQSNPAAPSRIQRGPNGETLITLDEATRKRIGLKLETLAPARLNPEIKGFGRVVDPAPLAALVNDLRAAQAALSASSQEYARLNTLSVQNNASARARETAEANAARDQTQAESARQKLLAGWGSAIAARSDLPAFVQSLVSLESALIRIDLPAGEALKSPPASARLVALADDSKPVEAQLIGPAPMVDPQMQGRGFLLLVTPNPSQLAPGAAVTGFLNLAGEAQSGVAVPRDAVIRFNGTAWVYLQTGDDTFQRTEIALDRPLDNGWFVAAGLKPQDKVVIVGAQQLLSEELKGQSAE
jgi:hypothetical protein